MMMKKVTVITASMAALLISTTANAEIKYADNAVAVGARVEVSDASESSNQYTRNTLELIHRSGYSWGELFAKYRIENFGEMSDKDKVKGTTNKFIGSLYHNINHSGSQVWFDLFTSANQAINENQITLGVAQKTKIAGINIKFSVGAHAAMGHNAKNGLEQSGFTYNGILTRINANYSINKNIILFGVLNTSFDRDMHVQKMFARDESTGMLAVAGAKYKFDKKLDMSVAYAHQQSWGGYNDNGDNINVAFSYHF
ncbi:hypothetical protein [Ferrimonas sp. SCSIO 43195]|uniref:hypothetical protein n=1 Tax=Ferrimonas sp. SCSIO 43195 TaxID=2822844 RepID=UPI002074F399|nr:hypothetical protein [Ferrimonas sp. SCSIO 43195]USD37309.1 hypothetical protein J8Z22_20375 [Ferrimonas sp. SCSIO 43195]